MAQALITEEMSGTEQVFRPAKRRKQYRRRNDKDVEHVPLAPERDLPQSSEVPQPNDSLDNAPSLLDRQASPVIIEELSLTELLRQRRILQRRKGGIEFTNRGEPSEQQETLVESIDGPSEQDEIANEIEKVVNRFAPQTGQIADVDKHMYDGQVGFLLSCLIQRLISKDGIYRFRTG